MRFYFVTANLKSIKFSLCVDIDFGHFLGNFKSKYGFKRERAPFVFTPQYAHVLGGVGSPVFGGFIDACGHAYNIVRKHGHLFLALFTLMLSTGMDNMPRFSSDCVTVCVQN